MTEQKYGSGYGKRPVWQWVLIYLVIGGIVYGIIYYFAYAPKGGYTTPAGTTNNNSQQTSVPAY
ncbi:MAG: hypothetical protein PHV42_03040 [Candidatus Pacebacteria bacterium]|nr:hypothetical protein [Candidatus Paceibacterota bacterium]